MSFDYQQAFARNDGFISREEQARLRQATVALAGLGGAGGSHASALARLGVGNFILADGDRFELANFNRQYGAGMSTVGSNKARVTAEIVRAINPEARIAVWEQNITAQEFPEFVAAADVVVDGIELFAIDAHRGLHRAARQAGRPVVLGCPLGFGGSLHVFGSPGMEFDRYFDFHDGQEAVEQVLAFVLGMSPAGLHLPYLDLARANLETQQVPSTTVGCLVATSLATTAVVSLLLERPGVRYAPHYVQFDARRVRLAQGCLRAGNRSLIQRLKKWWLMRRHRQCLQKLGSPAPTAALGSPDQTAAVAKS